MYSAVFFGWPTTSIRPEPWHVDADLEHRRGEHDVVGSLRRRRVGFLLASIGLPVRLRVRRPCPGCSSAPRERQRQLVERRSRCPPTEIREVSSPMFEPCEVVGAPRERLGVPGDAHRHVVVEVAPHAGELAGGAEVADRRHVRVGGVAVLVEQLLPGEQQHLGDADLRQREPDPVRADAEVLPPGCLVGDRLLLREEGVAHVEHLRREHVDAAAVERAHLVLGVPDGRGGGDDQRPDGLPVRVSTTTAGRPRSRTPRPRCPARR